ncbi:ALP1-like protein [Tanacetum coccineum]|uniref:ALP1-like protein n=1 Tax=Tanacetum coccineum TaxID=301880 RepID=A0ABQ4YRX0_9ASTR
MLEAVASYDLWIWHAFFGVTGANNDLTVFNNSPLFDNLLDDIAFVAPFECNGVAFEKGYYLADDIYPQWSSFVKSFTIANSEKNALFKRKQESACKDIERAFGVLQGRTQELNITSLFLLLTSYIYSYGQILDVSENGQQWIGLDISRSMLDVALERETDGDLILGDRGQVPFFL